MKMFLSDITTRSQIFDKCNVALKRTGQDHTDNNYGCKLIELCKNNDMFIVKGRMYNDKNIGILTCKNSSTVDYVLASTHTFEFIRLLSLISVICTLMFTTLSFHFLKVKTCQQTSVEVITNQL